MKTLPAYLAISALALASLPAQTADAPPSDLFTLPE